ncbi:MAG TPA: phosphonate ABC transporter, permease protein PhnE [Burkholderiaceae bacterium]|nr:phosphonate ABC transporter, permease protein PhnE [Burkholderiaceae bacterium]
MTSGMATGSASLAGRSRIHAEVVALLVVLAVVSSFAYLRLDYRSLFDAGSLDAMGRFVSEFFPPDLSTAFIVRTAWAALQTLAIATVGTLLAVIGGALLGLLASGRFGGAAAAGVRFGLNVLRSVPELVWAALMVLAAGLGPFAGALALALHTTGVLGRLFAEALQNAPRLPEAALTEAGSAPAMAFCYGTLPLVDAQWLSYSLYRLEMNIRMASVLGFVGAGGLGQMLYFHLSLFQQAQASTVLIATLLLVVTVDVGSSLLRQRLVPAWA